MLNAIDAIGVKIWRCNSTNVAKRHFNAKGTYSSQNAYRRFRNKGMLLVIYPLGLTAMETGGAETGSRHVISTLTQQFYSTFERLNIINPLIK